MGSEAVSRLRRSFIVPLSIPGLTAGPTHRRPSGLTYRKCKNGGPVASARVSAGHGFAPHFDPVQARAGRRPASGHQVREPDLVDLPEIGLLHPGPLDDFLDVEPAPTKVADVELPLTPVGGSAIGLVSHEPRAVGELENDAELAVPLLLGAPP